ncbi:unnamed protein product [Microthlaspi erraticum]|uniref:Retrotransposon gag domain-containing protein n=1 Tax=Microthlaspi erraticum TaxID=1685480 RepID=A0A6D2JJU1_9BRAS|nr:unnamed protein product [Microthlaspi erraticum]
MSQTVWLENLGGYKMKIPPFHGRNNPDEYMDWEKKCEFNFNLHNIIGDNRVKLAVSEFNDYALDGGKQIILAREIGGAFEITTWEEMKRIMRQRFVPGHYQRELHSSSGSLLRVQVCGRILSRDGGNALARQCD